MVRRDLIKGVGGENNGVKKHWNHKWTLENEQKKVVRPGHEIRGQRKRLTNRKEELRWFQLKELLELCWEEGQGQ